MACEGSRVHFMYCPVILQWRVRAPMCIIHDGYVNGWNMEESHIGVWRICHCSLNNLAGLALYKVSHIFQRLLEPAPMVQAPPPRVVDDGSAQPVSRPGSRASRGV